ncbi:MAG: type II secretion system F family protein [Tissierellia bacterium]|nr:type II secretion system F family protein [Tissierellia bacterium]
MKYKYKYIDLDGKIKTDTASFMSKDAAIDQLKSKGYQIVDIKAAGLQLNLGYNKKFSNFKISTLCSQLYLLLDSEVPVNAALDLIAENDLNDSFNKEIAKINQKVISGYSFSKAVEMSGKFPSSFNNAILGGETSGNLPKVLKRLAIYYNELYKTDKRIKNALYYPKILGVLMIIIVSFILTKVFPEFIDLFLASDIKLPSITQKLISISEFASKRLWLILITLFTIIILQKTVYQKSNLKYFIDKYRLINKKVFKFYQNMIYSQFLNVFSILIISEVDIIKSLEISLKSVENIYLAKSLERAKEKIAFGKDIGTAFSEIEGFPNIITQTIKVGEKTGKLSESLEHLSDYYNEEIRFSSEKFVALFEPAMIIIMAIIVGFVVLAIALPIFDIVNIY